MQWSSPMMSTSTLASVMVRLMRRKVPSLEHVRPGDRRAMSLMSIGLAIL